MADIIFSSYISFWTTIKFGFHHKKEEKLNLKLKDMTCSTLLVIGSNKTRRGTAPLVTDSPMTNFTTKHSRLVSKDRNLCRGVKAYFPGFAKPKYI